MMANEKRLIDANALISNLRTFKGLGAMVAETLVRFVKKQPTVDAVEVVHGHWCWEGKFKACSRCGSYVEWDETLGGKFLEVLPQLRCKDGW